MVSAYNTYAWILKDEKSDGEEKTGKIRFFFYSSKGKINSMQMTVDGGVV